MGKITENKLQKLNNLFSTSFELFTTKGFSKTSISDIVERAEVAKGTFYLYFKDKYDLRDKLTIYRAEKLFDHAITHSGYQNLEHFDDKLIAVIDNILDQLHNSPTLARFLNKNISWGVFNKTLSKRDTAEGTNYISLFKDEMEKEGVSYKSPEIMLYMIIELVSSTCHSIITDNEPVNFEEFRPHLHMCIRSIIKSYELADNSMS